MIDSLIEALTAARGPDRELDCALHEALTGQLDEQKNENRELNRQHGEMLLDLGAERRRVTVPPYTGAFDIAATLLPSELALKVTMNPPAVLAGIRSALPHAQRWIVSIWNPRTNGQVGVGYHSRSAALAMCLALLMHTKERR